MKSRQHGMALIMVLMMIAIMAALVTATQQYWLQAFSRSGNLHSRMQDKWAVLGAESVIIHHYSEALSASVLRPKNTGKMSFLKLDGHIFNINFRDLQTCFNLNAMFDEGKKTAPQQEHNSVDADEVADSSFDQPASTMQENDNATAKNYAEQVFIRLLQNTGSKEEEAKAIVDYIQDNSRKTGRMLADITELRQARVISPKQWRALSGMLCVLPDTRLKISVNGLTKKDLPFVSALLGTALTQQELDRWLAARPQKGWHSLEALKNACLPEESVTALNRIKEHLSFNSDYFELKIEQRDTSAWPLRSWIKRSDSGFTVIKRQYGISE